MSEAPLAILVEIAWVNLKEMDWTWFVEIDLAKRSETELG